MERHIGLWEKENSKKPAVAELIIDGNHIEFYQRKHCEVFAIFNVLCKIYTT